MEGKINSLYGKYLLSFRNLLPRTQIFVDFHEIRYRNNLQIFVNKGVIRENR